MIFLRGEEDMCKLVSVEILLTFSSSLCNLAVDLTTLIYISLAHLSFLFSSPFLCHNESLYIRGNKYFCGGGTLKECLPPWPLTLHGKWD